MSARSAVVTFSPAMPRQSGHMRLQDGAVRGGGFEITAGMQPDGVLEGAARIPLRGAAALARRTRRRTIPGSRRATP